MNADLNPIEERIQYHLACLEARKRNSPEPQAPWTQSKTVEAGSINAGAPGATFETLSLPPVARPRNPIKPKNPPPKAQKAETRSSGASGAPSAVSDDVRRQKSSSAALRNARAALPIPTLKQTEPMPFLSEKTVLIDCLLIRAGIPVKTVKHEALSLKVFDAYQNFERMGAEESKTVIVQKYEIGRHFCRSGMSNFQAFADTAIPLLRASDKKEMSNAMRSAEETVARLCKQL